MNAAFSTHAPFLVFAAACVAAFGLQSWWLRQVNARAVSWLVWLLGAVLLAGTWAFAGRAGERERLRVERLTHDFAHLYASEMELHGHWLLASDARPDDLRYLDLIELEKRWLGLNSLINDIYTFRERPDGAHILVVDSETDYDRNGRYEGEREQRTLIGEVYAEDAATLDRAFRGEDVFTPEPVMDRWGTWVSTYLPLHAPDGRVEAVLGVDYDASILTHAVAAAEWRVVAFLAIAQLIVLGASTMASLSRARQRATERLLAERERGETILTHTPGLFYLITEAGQFLRWNRNFERISGYSAAEIARMQPVDFISAADKAAVGATFQKVFVEGRAEVEADLLTKAGGQVPFIFAGALVVVDGQRCLAGSGLDISERNRIEAALRENRERLRRAVEGGAIGLWEWDITTNELEWNDQLKAIFGLPSQTTGLTLEKFLAAVHPDDCGSVQQDFRKALESHTEFKREYRIVRPDDAVRWVEATGRGEYDASGQPVSMVGGLVDRTERKQAEASMQELHRKLVDASRHAGMAEVATSVLHNVGNVLNSVSVSAEIVAGKVRQPKAGSLKRVAGLLREHAADLPAFLTSDPIGKDLPDYLLKLVEHLGEPPQGVLQELESLRKNIEHIKEIVAMQQRFARGSGVLEPLGVAELVEDAIHMNAAGFSRHEVQVERELSPVPSLVTDRHQVLQILVNLLSNAKYAVEHNPADKRVVVRVATKDTGHLAISVIDNGIGIAPENLARIFQHGFTTKQDGHGFGLHSGAIAAKELGGRLTVHSDGPGHGAVFTLELPLQNPIT